MENNPPHIPIERNNHRDDRNDIMPNNDAFREHNGNMEVENIILNGDAFERNNPLEDENDIIPNDFNEDRDEGEDEDEDEDEDEEECEYEDDIKSLNGDWGDAYFDHTEDNDEEEDENENDVVPNDAFRDLDDEIENNVADENYIQIPRMRLNPPKLEHIKNVLYVGLNQFFKEIEIEVVRCPCLTEPPFNLAAEGLSGKAVSWEVGSENNFVPVPQTNVTCNIPLTFVNQNFNSHLHRRKFFVIGAGYAAKPSMPSNGHLTMNATFSSFPLNISNNSCIVYEEAETRRRKLVIVDKPYQMICSMLGNFFISEGRTGKVIKVRAKGRKGNYDIISLIQRSLHTYFRYRIRLGGVLLMNGGRVLQHITPEKYPERINSYANFCTWPNCYELNCMNLIAIGIIGTTRFAELQVPNEPFLIGSRFKFNAFSNYEAAGQFINDVTPNDTEYIGYFNVAQYSLTSM